MLCRIATFFLCFCLTFNNTLSGNESICSNSVDVSFMVADIKYSKERGAQICEIQHGVDSTFKGEVFSNKGFGGIAKNFTAYFKRFKTLSWAFSKELVDEALKNGIQRQEGWREVSTLQALSNDRAFSKRCARPIVARQSIASYHGFVLAQPDTIAHLDQTLQTPSVVLIDRAFLPIRRDKYKVSLCFQADPALAACKPAWNLYPKEYTATLAQQICADLGGARFVIKPRGKFKGNGVIIVEKRDLDSTLKFILRKSKDLRNSSDRAYRSWYYEKADTFLVEEFVPADPVTVPHLGSNTYCPTVRIAFLLIYEEGRAAIHLLGGYYCLPEKPLHAPGTLHEKYKASLKTVHSSKIDAVTYSEITTLLEEPLLRFYETVLQLKGNAECYEESASFTLNFSRHS